MTQERDRQQIDSGVLEAEIADLENRIRAKMAGEAYFQIHGQISEIQPGIAAFLTYQSPNFVSNQDILVLAKTAYLTYQAVANAYKPFVTGQTPEVEFGYIEVCEDEIYSETECLGKSPGEVIDYVLTDLEVKQPILAEHLRQEVKKLSSVDIASQFMQAIYAIYEATHDIFDRESVRPTP
jgi:hypothetical protein